MLVTGNILLVSVTALIGQQLAPSASLATLPVSLQFLGLMAATLPSALLMGALGRRIGFLLGNSIGVIGAALAVLALQQHSFVLLCAATSLLGIAIGVGQQYRFAAIEACAPQQQAKAISLVMGGGVLAAVLGPNLATWSQGFAIQQPFIGAFLVLLGLYLATLLLVAFLPLPALQAAEKAKGGRGYWQLLRQPALMAAVISGSIGYGVMVLVMTATPLAMHSHHFAFDSTASVIQWHVLGMFLPSFFTGHLITRFGTFAIIQAGCVLLLLCVLIAQAGHGYWFFWTALVALGIGWNFTFIGATNLLTRTYAPNEKARAQGMNDFCVFGFSALGSLLAGVLQLNLGWQMMNLLMLPPVFLAMFLLWKYARTETQQSRS